MSYRKIHPGLDAVISDEQLDAFINSVPLALEEPPARVWPSVLAGTAAGATAGFLIGLASADYISLAQAALILIAVTVTAGANIAAERRTHIGR